MAKPTHTIALSERQLAITAEALEFYMRYCIGQFDVPTIVTCRQTARDYRKAHNLPDYPPREKQELLDELRKEYFPELHGPGHSYGVGWNDKPEQQHAQIAYEIYKAIYYERNMREGINNVHSYNGLHYSDQPRPEVKLLPSEEG